MAIENLISLSHEQRLFSLKKFINDHPYFELQDLYKWLYYGEFGYEEQVSYLKKEKGKPELHKLLEDIKLEETKTNLSDLVWKPMGLSFRFVMVFVTNYYKHKCPLYRLINLMERTPAFQGTRMHFKLDWGFVKGYIIDNMKDRFAKQDFYGFEDRINFHSLPLIQFTNDYLNHSPEKYRVVPRKLFFDFFPEFNDNSDLYNTRPGDSLVD
jgi:hypothetical protein